MPGYKQLTLSLSFCVVAFVQILEAQQPAEQKAPAPEVYSAKIMALSGLLAGTPTDVAIVVGRPSTLAELQRYEQALSEKDGQGKLATALESAYDVGAYRLGMDLSLAIKIVTVQQTDKGRHFVLVGIRVPLGRELTGRRSGPRDYHFTVIELDVDASGKGSGSYIPAAKLRFNKNHVPEVEDYQTAPAAVTSVHAERR
jgi:hypothetical protein